MAKNDFSQETQISVRLGQALLKYVRAHQLSMMRARPSARVTLSDALRELLEHRIDAK